MKKKAVIFCVAAAVVYVAAYLIFRAGNTEVWAKDGRAYLIFPKEAPAVYYAFRPVCYADGLITGIGFHIGPHMEQ